MDEIDLKDLKAAILLRLRTLNTFIRDLEVFAESHNINIQNEKIYVAACAQRKMLREILKINQ